MTPCSNGLLDTLNKANEIFSGVKQTSDATLDSRLLVSTADLSVKRTQHLNIGDAAPGIDVNDFINKCITFMRKGDASSQGARSTQRRRIGDDNHDSAEEGSADEGDAFNWEWLGRQACFPNNLRPPVPGFLLGPLSVQKRVRAQTQRRERLQKRDPRDAVRPEEIKAGAIEKSENSNLTALCRQIRALLDYVQVEGQKNAEAEATEDMTEDEIRALMTKHNVSDDGGVSLFRFVINPKSFGQTVENMFYVSFLIKEAAASIQFDSNQLPTLRRYSLPIESVTRLIWNLDSTETAEEKKLRKAKEKLRRANQEIQVDEEQEEEEQGPNERHQAVLHLDFDTWEDLIEAFDIQDSLIPHRQEGQEVQIGATGWYG